MHFQQTMKILIATWYDKATWPHLFLKFQEFQLFINCTLGLQLASNPSVQLQIILQLVAI